MTGKLQFNLAGEGAPGGFYPKLARAYCEGHEGTAPRPVGDVVLQEVHDLGVAAGAGSCPNCATGTAPVVINDPPQLLGPFPMSGGGFFWIKPTSDVTALVGFNTDQDPEPDVYLLPFQVKNEVALSDESKTQIDAKLTELGYEGLS